MLNIDGLLNKQVKIYSRIPENLQYTGYVRGACMVADGIDHSGNANDLNLVIELSEDTINRNGDVADAVGDLITLPLRSYRFNLALV
jgi:hypothetical protein